jgi:hypothetical protein
MKDLYLDDQRSPPAGWHHAKTTHEARAAMTGGVRRMSLDHDLGQDDGETGTNFVEWMAKTRNWPQEKPEVHSANPYGAKAMRALIDRTGPYDAQGHGVFTPGISAKDPHPPDSHQVGHASCPDPACCPCPCSNCMDEWRRSGRPMSKDCTVHGRP